MTEAKLENKELTKPQRMAIFALLFLLAIIFGLISVILMTDQSFHRLLVCFAFCSLGLGLRVALYHEKLKNPENAISYAYYLVSLLAVTSFIFLGFHATLTSLSTSFFYFLAGVLFVSMGFIVRTILNGLIG